MDNIKYIGCFFDPQDLQRHIASFPWKRLYRTIRHPHVTFAYRPSQVPAELFGLPVSVKAVGYGCDGENEALLVEFSDLPEELTQPAKQIRTPHITLSVSENGQSVNSGYLTFRPIAPFHLEGFFGGMDEEGNVHLK